MNCFLICLKKARNSKLFLIYSIDVLFDWDSFSAQVALDREDFKPIGTKVHEYRASSKCVYEIYKVSLSLFNLSRVLVQNKV
jgi:hypothetical protein